MNFAIDIILLAIAAFIVIKGAKNGFVKSVINFAADIAAAVVAYALTPIVAGYFYDNILLEKISSGIEGTVASVARTGTGYNVGKFVSDIPEILLQILEKYGIGTENFKSFAATVKGTGESAVKEISDFIAAPTATVVANALSFLAIFIVALIVLRIVSMLIILLFKAPVARAADKTAGLVFGAVNALFVLWILSIAISLAVSALGSFIPDWFGKEVIDNSFVLKFFSTYNPVIILKNVLSFKG